MSDENKDKQQPPKLQFTKETVERQIEETAKELSYFQDKVQQTLGLLNYLRVVRERFDLPSAPKPPLEVK